VQETGLDLCCSYRVINVIWYTNKAVNADDNDDDGNDEDYDVCSK